MYPHFAVPNPSADCDIVSFCASGQTKVGLYLTLAKYPNTSLALDTLTQALCWLTQITQNQAKGISLLVTLHTLIAVNYFGNPFLSSLCLHFLYESDIESSAELVSSYA